jgi:hypothetical protein
MDVFYKTHDPDSGAAQLEALVRADVGSLEPVPYRIVGAAGGTSQHTSLSDMALRAFGGSPASLYSVEFQLPGHRRAVLYASMMRNADWAYCGSLAYSIQISRRPASEISFEKRKAVVVGPRFAGDEAAEKLNRVSGLAGRTDKVLETSMFVAMATLRQTPLLRIVPDEAGAWLLIRTLPVVKMGLKTRSATTNAGTILQIAGDIESAL